MSKENSIELMSPLRQTAAFIDHLVELSVLTWSKKDIGSYRVNPSFELKRNGADGTITLISSIIMDHLYIVLVDNNAECTYHPYFTFGRTEYICHDEFCEPVDIISGFF